MGLTFILQDQYRLHNPQYAHRSLQIRMTHRLGKDKDDEEDGDGHILRDWKENYFWDGIVACWEERSDSLCLWDINQGVNYDY